MSGHFELLTVAGVARALEKSEKGVRRLIQRGKLRPIKEGRRYLIPVEEVQRYAATLPHPVHVMAALYRAWSALSVYRYQASGWAQTRRYVNAETRAVHEHFLCHAVPVYEGIVAAAKVRNYRRIEELQLDLTRLAIDYQMLHAPFKAEPVPPRERTDEASRMLPLFGDAEGGTA
ncbi:helix-turn-helix domain-containing protein [Deinococcus sp. NW-56]|uniref:helix-turn-helix domain-containing protein n=1 Tax=Deinococcus sp. NW-56 TaxID=2080419 RepID=UPI000CF3E75D|nr:helix-turn-helix domain-containing protein [Deinococcus sp. NW-56]